MDNTAWKRHAILIVNAVPFRIHPGYIKSEDRNYSNTTYQYDNPAYGLNITNHSDNLTVSVMVPMDPAHRGVWMALWNITRLVNKAIVNLPYTTQEEKTAYQEKITAEKDKPKSKIPFIKNMKLPQWLSMVTAYIGRREYMIVGLPQGGSHRTNLQTGFDDFSFSLVALDWAAWGKAPQEKTKDKAGADKITELVGDKEIPSAQVKDVFKNIPIPPKL